MKSEVATSAGDRCSQHLAAAYEHLLLNLLVGACLWVICFWIYKQQPLLRTEDCRTRFCLPMTTIARLILVAVLMDCCALNVPRSDAVEVRYELTDEVLLNPERGFYEQFTAHSEGEPISLQDLKELRQQGMSLLVRLYYLEKFRDTELNAQQRSLIETDFRTIRAAGCKSILRFAYSRGLGQPDAPLDVVLNHIEQLKPILQENADVIAVMQAGFIGAGASGTVRPMDWKPTVPCVRLPLTYSTHYRQRAALKCGPRLQTDHRGKRWVLDRRNRL